uniref:Uncharacterized protein n=2 Tax=Ursus TaxID=9639 RepID=A0A452TJI3_URSMA
KERRKQSIWGEVVVERDKATSPYVKSFVCKKQQCSPKALVCLIFPNLIHYYLWTIDLLVTGMDRSDK